MLNYFHVILWALLAVVLMGQEIRLKTIESERDSAIKQVSILSADLVTQNEAVTEMKDESARQITNLLAAQKDAIKVRDSYNKKAQALLKAHVSKDCNEAVKWGIKQSGILYQCWRVDCRK